MEVTVSRSVNKKRAAAPKYLDFPCDLCGSSKATVMPHCVEYTRNNELVHICNDCGFIYAPKRRSFSDIADAWSNEIYSDTFSAQVYTARIPAIKARQVFVAEMIDTTVGLKGKSVCDIGAGEGQFLEIIRKEEYGAKVFGVEPSDKNCRTLTQNGIENFKGAIEDYAASKSFGAGKFDVVTIMWTLETATSCRDMMNIAHKLLKKGGHVVVATGSRILVPFKKTLRDYIGDGEQDTHPFRFSANTLKGLMKISNFEVAHENQWRDHDVMCIIGRKSDKNLGKEFVGDNYLDVYKFFERWHVETKMYYSK